MSQSVQTRENHARLDPMFHFFLAPVSFLLFCASTVQLFRHYTTEGVFIPAAFFLLFLLVFKVRLYSLKVQDRVIRLEERLRLDALSSDELKRRIPQLTEAQLIALRFAPDAELPALAGRALEQKLDAKQIKAAIQTWRPDYMRV